MSTSLILLLCITLVMSGIMLIWYVNRPVVTKPMSLISMGVRTHYEGPPEPCAVYQAYHADGTSCLAARSLITGKDRLFPNRICSLQVAAFFRAYGYTLAVETIDSKIKLVAWDY